MIATFSIAIVMICCGCHSVTNVKESSVERKLDLLYHAYLRGNYDQASQSMLDYLGVVPTIKTPHGRAYNYVFAYSRLYSIEASVGNNGLADLYLIKLRYWSITASETADIGRNEIIESVKSLTSSNYVAFVDEWDKAHNGGRQANYRRITQ